MLFSGGEPLVRKDLPQLAAYADGKALGLWIGSIDGGSASLVRPDIGYLLGKERCLARLRH